MTPAPIDSPWLENDPYNPREYAYVRWTAAWWRAVTRAALAARAQSHKGLTTGIQAE